MNNIVSWMISKLEEDSCLYQDDVVDYLVKNNFETYLTENSEGNLVLNRNLLEEFKKRTENNVVWVRNELYWRWRVPEDEPGRIARG
jgi:ATP-dependent RNA helicase hrpA